MAVHVPDSCSPLRSTAFVRRQRLAALATLWRCGDEATHQFCCSPCLCLSVVELCARNAAAVARLTNVVQRGSALPLLYRNCCVSV